MKDQTPLNKAVPSMIWHSRDYRFNSLLALIFSGVFYLGVYHFSQVSGRFGKRSLVIINLGTHVRYWSSTGFVNGGGCDC